MIQRNAPALGFTFEEARAAGLQSGASREAYAKTTQQAAQMARHGSEREVEAARATLQRTLAKARGMAATGHAPVGTFVKGTIGVSRKAAA